MHNSSLTSKTYMWLALFVFMLMGVSQSFVHAAVSPAVTTQPTPIKVEEPVKSENTISPASTPAPSQDTVKKEETKPTPAPTLSPASAAKMSENTQYLATPTDTRFLYINTSTASASPQTRYESQPFTMTAGQTHTMTVNMVPYNLLGAQHNGGIRFEIICWDENGCTAPDGSAVPLDTQLAIIRLRPGSVAGTNVGRYMRKTLSGISFPQTNARVIVRITAAYGTEVGVDEVKVSTPTGINLVRNGEFTEYQDVNLSRNYPAYFSESTNASYEYTARPGKAVIRGRYQPDFTNGQTQLNAFRIQSDPIRPEQLYDQYLVYEGTVTKKRPTGGNAKIVVKNLAMGFTAYSVNLDTSGAHQRFTLHTPLPYIGRYTIMLVADNGMEIVLDKFALVGSGGPTRNPYLDSIVEIQTATRQPKFWGAGSNNMNFAYSEIVETGMNSPGSPPDTTP